MTFLPLNCRLGRPLSRGKWDHSRCRDLRIAIFPRIGLYPKKITECMRKLLWYVEECVNAKMGMNAGRSQYDNSIVTSNNTGASLENVDDGYTEIVTMDKRREAMIVNVKCPCGASYQILLLKGICYYKLV
ncbi:hypothetical protein OWV82_006517 [Melia azedarach]|uniref:Uncharacterized protein n=1 Tax=Melia azedarach TaxID=155640 RepID=A0ACC1YIR8_MELAZ|nr:hypothetical protein OWV82_006517 [Melia azedarach]